MRVDTCAERIRKGLEIRNMKAIELCRKTGIPKSAMSQYINNKFEPRQDRVYLIAKALNVSEAWLMGYNVDIAPINNEKEIIEDNDKLKDITLDDFTYAIYNEMKELSEEDKKALLDMAKIFKNHLDNKNK